MKVSTNVKPPKRKVTGYTQTKKAEVVKKGGSSTEMSVDRGVTKKTYTPTKIETGDPRYGKVGGGTDKEMNRLLHEAQEKKRDVTDFGTSGRTKDKTYKAGTTTTSETPPKLTVKTNVTPTIKKVSFDKKPIYEKATIKKAKLKPMDVTVGGENKKGSPATKYGLGTKKKVKIRKVVSHPKY